MPVKSSQNLYWHVSEQMLFFYFAKKGKSKMQNSLHSSKETGHFCTCIPVEDLDFELRRGPGSTLLVQQAFLRSVISSFFAQSKEGARAPQAPPLDPPLYTSLKGDQLYEGFLVVLRVKDFKSTRNKVIRCGYPASHILVLIKILLLMRGTELLMTIQTINEWLFGMYQHNI